jgi:hypothetical protein
MLRLTFVLAAVALSATASRSAEWVDADGDLGRDTFRIGLQAAAGYGTLEGSELSGTGAASGFEGGLFVPVIGPFSLWGSFALGQAAIDAQIQDLLDVPVRADRRSGYVIGDVKITSIRVDTRIHAFREQRWRVRPYFGLAWVRSEVELDIASVDGQAARAEIRTLTDTSQGALARAGFEYPILKGLTLDLSGSFEVLEAPPGTNNLFSFVSGLTYRI